MTDTPDYGKWIRDALAANPRLSKAGLTRHLRHGLDRTRVLKMIDGRRRIQIDELPAIAAYLGVPPPMLRVAVSDRAAEIARIGVIAPGVWIEAAMAKSSDAELERKNVPAAVDQRYPPARQGYYEIQVACAAVALLPGDCLLTVSIKDAKPRPFVGDLVVIARERAGLRQFGLARVAADLSLVALTAAAPDETLKPVALVIGLYRDL